MRGPLCIDGIGVHTWRESSRTPASGAIRYVPLRGSCPGHDGRSVGASADGAPCLLGSGAFGSQGQERTPAVRDNAHIGSLAFASTVTWSFATNDDDVDTSALPCRPVPLSRDGRYASTQWALVDWLPSRQSTSLGWCVTGEQLHRRTRIRFSSSKDPPKLAANLCGRRKAGRSYLSRRRLARRS